MGPRANDNDCAFLVDHAAVPEAGALTHNVALWIYLISCI